MVKRYQGENEIIPEMRGACSSLNDQGAPAVGTLGSYSER
jgi:hypothetical protein